MPKKPELPKRLKALKTVKKQRSQTVGGKGEKIPQKQALEARFDAVYEEFGLPLPEKHYRFNKPHSRHEFDRAWPSLKIAVEIEGGVFMVSKAGHQGGRHASGAGYTEDCLKYNMATALGWTIIRLTSPMVKKKETYVPLIKLIKLRMVQMESKR